MVLRISFTTACLVFGLAWTAPAHAEALASPSFVNDVIPIFTRFGCNQGACHGKGAGQNGFRLSLRGYAPEMDHAWLTREFSSRRISTADPESSTLLRKTAGQAPHEGGKLVKKGDRAYSTLLAWVRAGTPGPRKDEPAVRSLTITPASLTLAVGKTTTLRIDALFSDGQTRDVTWLSKFESNDAGMADVSAAGEVRVRRPGETAVRVAFQGEVGVVIVTAPHERPVAPERLAKKNNFIDEHVFHKLAALRIEPSDLCTDDEFLRRAYLDTIGVLPTPAEVKAFLADSRADKRSRLIDHLLERPEFIDYWALFLGDLLQNRKERDHDVRGTKGVRGFHAWLRKQVAQNRPWDQLAREVLTGQRQAPPTTRPSATTSSPSASIAEAERSEVVDSVAQAFLGTRIGCARCHNHPLERYTQDDFYHFAGFFSRVAPRPEGPQTGPDPFASGRRGRQGAAPGESPRRRQPAAHRRLLAPRPLDRSSLPGRQAGDDPRVPLVDWMTDPKNEAFSGAMVNRLWRHFLGVGLVEPVDDLRASNPPTNPALWAALNKEFVEQQVRPEAPDALILQVADLSAVERHPAGQREGRAFLFALLRPPAAGRGAARRLERGDGRAGRVRRLSRSASGQVSCPTPGCGRTSSRCSVDRSASRPVPASAAAR